MSWHKAARADAVAPGECRSVTVQDAKLLLCRQDSGELFAVADCCSHDGAPLADGTLHGAHLECPRHGARFDITTGRAVRMPAVAPIDTYPVQITDDGWVSVAVEEDAF